MPQKTQTIQYLHAALLKICADTLTRNTECDNLYGLLKQHIFQDINALYGSASRRQQFLLIIPGD